MRWNKKPKPQLGDVRIVKKFLWFPKCINGEYRFLEVAIFKQKYDYCVWEDIEWIDYNVC